MDRAELMAIQVDKRSKSV